MNTCMSQLRMTDVSAWCTSDASSCVLHDLRRQLTSSVRTCMCWVYIVTTLLLFSKVTKPVLGPHLWQPGLSAVSSWVITFRCNIKCPCAFWSLIFHGVSDWRREDKMFVLTCQHTKTLITYSCNETVSCIIFFPPSDVWRICIRHGVIKPELREADKLWTNAENAGERLKCFNWGCTLICIHW